MAFEEGRRPEIELVVARHEHVRRREVEQIHDMRALVEPGHQRGREGIAGMDVENRDAAGALGLHDRVEPREPAAALHLAHQVDVVDEQQRQRRLGRRGRDRAGGRRQAGGQARPEAEGLATIGTRHGRGLSTETA